MATTAHAEPLARSTCGPLLARPSVVIAGNAFTDMQRKIWRYHTRTLTYMYKTDNMHVLFGYSLTWTHTPANDSSQVLPLARFFGGHCIHWHAKKHMALPHTYTYVHVQCRQHARAIWLFTHLHSRSGQRLVTGAPARAIGNWNRGNKLLNSQAWVNTRYKNVHIHVPVKQPFFTFQREKVNNDCGYKFIPKQQTQSWWITY